LKAAALYPSCLPFVTGKAVGRVLTRRLFGRRQRQELWIKSFRAVTARATFLCLCKETWRKESTPRLRARCCAPGPRSRRDFPGGILPPRKTPHIHVRRPSGLIRRLRRFGGPRRSRSRATAEASTPANP